MFQFHTGSIKSLTRDPEMRNIPKFQFHTGSIKRQPNEIPKEAVYMFQFHTGSIKSEPDPKNPLYPPNARFNSILVRLKEKT